jgi:hypothetical protein
MKRYALVLTAVAATTVALPLTTAAQSSVSGLGLRYAVPYDAMADTHDPGYGFTWASLGDLGTVWASLSGGWTRFKGTAVDETEGGSPAATIDQAELLFGMGLKLGRLWVGAKAGYFFRDEDEWDVVPTVTLRRGRLVLIGEAKVLGDVRWYGGQLSLMSN